MHIHFNRIIQNIIQQYNTIHIIDDRILYIETILNHIRTKFGIIIIQNIKHQ